MHLSTYLVPVASLVILNLLNVPNLMYNHRFLHKWTEHWRLVKDFNTTMDPQHRAKLK